MKFCLVKTRAMKKLFGTDGIRSEANKGLMRPEAVLKIAQAIGAYFIANNPVQGDHIPTVVIGKDTRLSGYMIEAALQAGFLSVGMNVLLLGPVPTPAIALLTRSFRAQLGVMISASHNPAKDNGLKFFGPDGYKLCDEQEKEITKSYFEDDIPLSHAYTIGKAHRIDDAAGRYLEYVKSTFPKDLRLDKFKIVVDCAQGAAYKIARLLYWELGADVIALNTEPDGLNINKNCGATHIEGLQKAVLEHKADIGFALDGDADRLIAVDEKGEILDGDKLIAAIAEDMKKDNILLNDTVVVTQMSNLGLELFFNKIGIKTIRSQVGDRYVLEDMKKYGANLGGEQSGHIILKKHSSTGDALIASLRVLKILLEGEKTTVCLQNIFQKIPQKLVNIEKKASVLNNPEVLDIITKTQMLLKDRGRVFIRPSGTEPLIRIMVEAEDIDMLETAMINIVNVIETQ
jgi:phosphoglucosamine mutase